MGNNSLKPKIILVLSILLLLFIVTYAFVIKDYSLKSRLSPDESGGLVPCISGVMFNPNSQTCCTTSDGKSYDIEDGKDLSCCASEFSVKAFDPEDQSCCVGLLGKDSKVSDGKDQSCCDSTPFYMIEKTCCIEGNSAGLDSPAGLSCCGTFPFDPNQKFCCTENSGAKVVFNKAPGKCCAASDCTIPLGFTCPPGRRPIASCTGYSCSFKCTSPCPRSCVPGQGGHGGCQSETGKYDSDGNCIMKNHHNGDTCLIPNSACTNQVWGRCFDGACTNTFPPCPPTGNSCRNDPGVRNDPSNPDVCTYPPKQDGTSCQSSTNGVPYNGICRAGVCKER